MVRAVILVSYHTDLYVLEKGHMVGGRYIEYVLLQHVRRFRGAVSENFCFVDDNATCHRTQTVQDCLQAEYNHRKARLIHYPELNPIGIVCDTLGRCIAAPQFTLTNKETLSKSELRALKEECINFPQHLLDHVVVSICSFCCELLPRITRWPHSLMSWH